MQIGSHAIAQSGTAPVAAEAVPLLSKLFGDDGLTFRDVLDLINPLQHIPVVGNLYRKLTGDTLDPAIRVAGGALFGGPLGAALSVGSLLMEREYPSDPASPVMEETPTALAAAGSREPYRGGWIVNAAMTGQLPLPAPTTPSEETVPSAAKLATLNQPETRRGGWMVTQAYALSDLQQAATSAAKGRIDQEV